MLGLIAFEYSIVLDVQSSALTGQVFHHKRDRVRSLQLQICNQIEKPNRSIPSFPHSRPLNRSIYSRSARDNVACARPRQCLRTRNVTNVASDPPWKTFLQLGSAS